MPELDTCDLGSNTVHGHANTAKLHEFTILMSRQD